MTDHTPEPWGRDGNALIDPQGDTVDGVYQIAAFTGRDALANLDRTIACVNACVGIPTEQLGGRSVAKMIAALKFYGRDDVIIGQIIDGKISGVVEHGEKARAALAPFLRKD